MKLDCDSLIFDMDGTLWNAVDSYCTIWNTTFDRLNIPHHPVTCDTLMKYMGMHLEDIVKNLCDDVQDKDTFLKLLDNNERTMMLILGGRLYPDVTTTISKIARGRRLFMVSNCGSHGLENFLDYTGLRPYFTEALSHGGTGLDKTDNIKLLIKRHQLKSPYYVGDTQGDANAARKAGVGLIFASYGFGHVDKPDFTLKRFKDLEDIITLK